MQTKTYVDSNANGRLEELGLSAEILVQAVTEGQLAHASCTDNDPKNFPGLAVWARINRSLREQLIPLGWTKNDVRGQPHTVNPDGDLSIVVFSGDDETGNDKHAPQPKNSKGTATLAAVRRNEQQLTLFPTPAGGKTDQRDRLTWVLLFARQNDEVRCEFSLPRSVDQDGLVMSWEERIILPSITIGDDWVFSKPDDEPSVDVEVTRKSS